VEPWGVVTHNGRWYMVGQDPDRDPVRSLPLYRIGDDLTPNGPQAWPRPQNGGARPPHPLADQFTTTACLTAARSAEGALGVLSG
ncbi:WYL domain-containing protein, partial [Nocardia brasiliensis]|uniref:WYL domain-containing protein n=1 Tax=Nocardia brasiliensis TaxID=37326 RepID=UPI00245444C0